MRIKTRFKIAIILILIAVAAYTFYYKSIIPVIVLVCEENARIYAKNVINETATEILSEDIFEHVMTVNTSYDQASEFIKTNTAKVNEIALRLSLSAQEKMQNNEKLSASLPIGALTGMVFLSNTGPEIEIDFIPSGTIAYEYKTIVKTSGINQVNYKIILYMITTVNLIIPGNHKQISVDSEVILVDCVVAGKVPDVYFNSSSSYDLTP